MIRQEDTRVGRSGIAARAELAAFEFRQADRLERREPTDPTDAQFLATEARHARRDGEVIFQPPKDLVGSAGTELVPGLQAGDNLSACRQSLVNTLGEPNIICVDASEHRAALATRGNVLSQALDAQVTAQASNSIEKMLCHQLAITHTVAMEAFIRLQDNYPALKPAIEQVRLMNSAARLLEVFQSGCLSFRNSNRAGHSASRSAISRSPLTRAVRLS